MYRLIAVDIDDTLLARDRTLPAGNLRALEALATAGVTIVLSSGRATIAMQDFVAHLPKTGEHSMLVSFNGARVTEIATGAVVHEDKVGSDTIDAIATVVRPLGVPLLGYTPDEVVYEPVNEAAVEAARMYSEGIGMAYRPVENIAAALPSGSHKMLIVADPALVPDFAARLEPLRDGRFHTMRSKPQYLEIVPAEASKGHALERVAAILGIPLADTLAVGDGENDVEMIRRAGVGMAVANAAQLLKNHADVVLARSCDEAVLEEVFERYFT